MLGDAVQCLAVRHTTDEVPDNEISSWLVVDRPSAR